MTDDGSPNLTDDETITITVNEVNDAPTVSAGACYIATEQEPLALHGTGLEVSDPDAGAGDVKLELEADFGVIDATAGTTGTDVSVSDEGVVTLTGTIAEISDLLAGNGGARET